VKSPARNLPYFALGTAAVLVLAALIAVATMDPDRTATPLVVSVVGLILTTVPSLIAAAFAERTNRDIRNGTVTDKARVGALSALHETGVTQVAQNALTASPVTLEALAKLVDAMHREPPRD